MKLAFYLKFSVAAVLHFPLHSSPSPNMQPLFQHFRNLLRHGVMHRRGRMQRVVPQILLQPDTTLLVKNILYGRISIFAAVLGRFFVNGRLGVCVRVVHHCAEERVRVEVEDGGVGVLAGQVGGEGEEALVPV